jgi:hypothetical protein
LSSSIARQPCPAAPCPAALLGSLARQPCPADLPGSLARQFDQFRLDLFLVQFHHAFIICMRALLSSRQVQTCSVVLMYTFCTIINSFTIQKVKSVVLAINVDISAVSKL